MWPGNLVINTFTGIGRESACGVEIILKYAGDFPSLESMNIRNWTR